MPKFKMYTCSSLPQGTHELNARYEVVRTYEAPLNRNNCMELWCWEMLSHVHIAQNTGGGEELLFWTVFFSSQLSKPEPQGLGGADLFNDSGRGPQPTYSTHPSSQPPSRFRVAHPSGRTPPLSLNWKLASILFHAFPSSHIFTSIHCPAHYSRYGRAWITCSQTKHFRMVLIWDQFCLYLVVDKVSKQTVQTFSCISPRAMGLFRTTDSARLMHRIPAGLPVAGRHLSYVLLNVSV